MVFNFLLKRTMQPKYILGVMSRTCQKKDQCCGVTPWCRSVQCVVSLSQGTKNKKGNAETEGFPQMEILIYSRLFLGYYSCGLGSDKENTFISKHMSAFSVQSGLIHTHVDTARVRYLIILVRRKNLSANIS